MHSCHHRCLIDLNIPGLSSGIHELPRTELVGVDTVRFKAEVQFNTQASTLDE